jgi:hypothetical protein
MNKNVIILTFLTLLGCPDPIESGSATPSANAQEDPASINGSGPAKMESDPNAARLNLQDGEGLTISGTFQYGGTATGSKRVDVQKYREGSAPSLVHTLEISDDNSFSFQVPPDYGKILITGFIDKAGNGPTPDDPQGRLSLEIAAEAQKDVILEVSDDYTPPSPPGGGGAPEQNKPPQQGQPDGQPQDGQPQDGQPQDGQPQGGQPQDGQPQGGQPDGQPQDGQPQGVVPAQGQPGTQNETPGDGATPPPKEQDGPPADDGQP